MLPQMKTTSEQIEKVSDLLKDFSTAILITHDSAGTIHARPMAIADLTEPCDLWFITKDESAKVHEIESDTRVQVVGQMDGTIYFSLAGRASLVRDRARIEAVWKESLRVWFPEGKTDPHLVLIHVIPDRAEYWDNHGIYKKSHLWEAAIAYVSGDKRLEKEAGEHGVVSLS